MDERWRPPGEGRADGGEEAGGVGGRFVLIGVVKLNGEGLFMETGESVKTVGPDEDEETLLMCDGVVGLDDGELTSLTVACELESLFNESWEEGRDVTVKAGGGERSLIGVGTIGFGSVRSYAAAAFGDGFGLDADGGGEPARSSNEPSGAVWLRGGGWRSCSLLSVVSMGRASRDRRSIGAADASCSTDFPPAP